MVETWLSTYGYLAVFVGTFLEGETILVAAGFAAHRGLLHLPTVILAAVLGSMSGDQFYFHLARRRRGFFQTRFPHWRERSDRIFKLLERFPRLAILSMRFLYGLRTISPFVIGMSSIPALQYLWLNAVSAVLWASTVATVGYFLGAALEDVLGDIRHLQFALLLAILAVGALCWIARYRRRRRERLAACVKS